MNLVPSAPYSPQQRSPYADAPPEYLAWYESRFFYDLLSVRQKLLTLAQRYEVEDEMGRPRFRVVRPPKVFLNILAGIVGGVITLVFAISGFMLLLNTQQVLAALVLFIVGNILGGVVATLLAPYRHTHVYADTEENNALLTISQDNKLAFTQRYSLYDPFGVLIATFERNNLYSLLRRRWRALTPDGQLICIVQEDNIWLAMARRYLGTLYGLLRTNFVFEYPNGTNAGEYNRKLTLTDQYLLDLRRDPMRLLDRRVTLALAILLDTGEAR